MYFPMFEAELQAKGLPADLKYLAVVESALTPHAISHVGATGLWQFMRPTAREYGLQITKYIDERCDPVMSTRAAIQYLTNLYRAFDSWELAMAAYNAGPGRIRLAIRKSGTQDYWDLQKYLPKETQAYVPGFIAASYILNYYSDHGLQPAFPTPDLLETTAVPIYKNLNFSQIETVTGLPVDVIRNLNPKYVRQFIPQSETGHLLVLPTNSAASMQQFLASGRDIGLLANAAEVASIETGVEMEYVNKLVEHTYIVRSGDNLYNISRKYDCSVADLQRWNNMSGTMLRIGQRMKVKRMERVLVKTQSSAPAFTATVRQLISIKPLTGKDFFTAADERVKNELTATPVIRQTPDLTGSSKILQRRTSAYSLVGAEAFQNQEMMPGQRLK
jgi:membrane-bound lytic murein transglycosylase D